MKIGDEVYVHGYIDEIRQDTVIIRNEGGYFGTAPSEVIEKEETLQNLTKPNKSDLIVKGAGEIKDGLYNIKDGKLFKYKANGGTVRTYQIVSAERPKWIPCSERLPKEPRGNREIENYLTCDENGHRYIFSWANGWNCCFNSDGSLYKDQEITDIVAWMPLPDAYKESDADGSD